MAGKLKFNLKLILAIVFTISLFIGASSLFFINAGNWLLVADHTPVKIDIICSFAGENVRNIYCRELMKKYPSAHWIMSDYKNGYNRILKRDSFDMSRVSVFDTCTNTLSEVNNLKLWIQQIKINSGDTINIGLVSGPYHMRRIKMMVEKNISGSNVHIYYLPVPLDRYKWTKDMYKSWWRSSSVKGTVISELQKILYYIIIS